MVSDACTAQQHHLLLACKTMKELKIGQNKTKGGNRLGLKYDSKGNKLDG
jgi:hypothetical protein